MTFGRVGTCGAGVVFVKAKAMGPAVKHLGAIIGSGQAWCGDSSQGGRRWSRASGKCGNRIGAVESGLASGEVLKAFFVCRIEDRLELSKGSGGSGVGEPGVTCMGEHTGGFEEEMGEVDGDGIRDGVSASSSNVLDFMETFPQ